ncbi:hypothetical protein B0I35DRAFT_444084 [Stachybotrys elegans]|uniref:BZIP domain-containing protein n=1 Tax=Stachybotrys elegans TaxID=80388 RepID=A0A8K0SKJ0_9HYPO|nr:hypothetical protein B0I35DRAFT_444084 [Stachybotrys elegans]
MAGCNTELHALPIDSSAVGASETGLLVSKPDRAQQDEQPLSKPRRAHLGQAVDAAKTHRLTENKRRYRARRKEYVSDLERRLAEAREQGIKATVEVQLEARRVIVENGRLRDLLLLAGFSDEDVNVWTTCGQGVNGGDGAYHNRRRDVERRATLCATLTADSSIVATERVKTCSPDNTEENAAWCGSKDTAVSSDDSRNEELMAAHSEPLNYPLSKTTPAVCSPPATDQTSSTGDSSSDTIHKKELVPCKLLSLLAENPAADITQVPVPPDPVEPPHDEPNHDGNVECGKAYQMLISYATCEEKMDIVARTLEGGCTKIGKGGCAVKKTDIWQALDHMCG